MTLTYHRAQLPRPYTHPGWDYEVRRKGSTVAFVWHHAAGRSGALCDRWLARSVAGDWHAGRAYGTFRELKTALTEHFDKES